MSPELHECYHAKRGHIEEVAKKEERVEEVEELASCY